MEATSRGRGRVGGESEAAVAGRGRCDVKHTFRGRLSTWPLMLAACASCEAGLPKTAVVCALCAAFGMVSVWVEGVSSGEVAS